PNGTIIEHVFATNATTRSFRVVVTATDSFGNSSQRASHRLSVKKWELQEDVKSPGVTHLVYGGSLGIDGVDFSTREDGAVVVREWFLNNHAVRQESVITGVTGKIIVFAQAGNDVMDATGITRLAVELHGDDGDDMLKGGSLADWLIGGEGSDWLEGNGENDRLEGGNGRDLLVGGMGADTIMGGGGNDLLLAASFLQANDRSAAVHLLEEWKRTDHESNMNHRIGNLQGLADHEDRMNAHYLLETSSLVEDEGAIDQLFGAEGTDWLLLDPALDLHPDREPDDWLTVIPQGG
ncbi:MAG: calcium-binding protein, partial [Planctomycetota bacterium]